MNEREEKEALDDLDFAYQCRKLIRCKHLGIPTDNMAPEEIQAIKVESDQVKAAYLLLRSKFDEALELIADLRMDLVDVRQSVRWLESDQ